ncbi:MAG: ParB N-terminal domain-containing protein [Magnetococcales bacterium]|nr:ParB N-terminal domain-containing protein [Magnetococcales bacterium]
MKNDIVVNQIKSSTIPSEEIGNLYFGQLHVHHQEYFDKKFGQHTRIKLRDLPHYTFWRDQGYENPKNSDYYSYLIESWKYYFPGEDDSRKRMTKVADYINLMKDISKNGIEKPIPIISVDGRDKIIIDGNHRASIAYHLGIDIKCVYLDIQQVMSYIVNNPEEFYGTKNKSMPYQSIFLGRQEIVRGRRTDILERFLKLNIANDIRGKSVIDLGSNIGMNAMFAWFFGAKIVTAIEYSRVIASSALKLSTILDCRINVIVHDLGVPVKCFKKFDTVFCLSLYAHVKNKEILERNIVEVTGNVLYFEGHIGSKKEDYQHIFRHFEEIQELGFNRDGIHNDRSTRPFFRCLKKWDKNKPHPT